MATHSLIGLENTDGTIDYIYCHFDGYASGVGKKLSIMIMKIELSNY